MSLIACTNDCHYQRDGCCTLEQAVTSSLPQAASGLCVNFVPRRAGQDSQRHPTALDVPNVNELGRL